MGRQQHLTRMSVGQGLERKWSMTLTAKGHERLQVHKRRRVAELEVEEVRAPGDPALLEQPDVEMLNLEVEAPAESASVKRGADAVADDEGLCSLVTQS